MKPTRLKFNRRRGLTLVEVMVASILGTLVIFGGISIYLSGMENWLRGSERIVAETQSRQAVRAISDQLRQAMAVAVAGDGVSLEFRLPEEDASGNFTVPATWDGVVRRIQYNAGDETIELVEGANTRVLARNVMPADIGGTGAAYDIFTAGPGAITRQLTIKVVTQTNNDASVNALGRQRETIYLRNIPQLTR